MKWVYPQNFTLQETGSFTVAYDFTDSYDCPSNPTTQPEPSSDCCVNYFMPFASQDKFVYSHTQIIKTAKTYDMNGAEFAINPIDFQGKNMTLNFCKVPKNINCFTVRVNNLCLEMGFQRIDCDVFCEEPPIPTPPPVADCFSQLTVLGTTPSLPIYSPQFTYNPAQASIVSFLHFGGSYSFSAISTNLNDYLALLLADMQSNSALMAHYTVSLAGEYLNLKAKVAGNAYNLQATNIGNIGNVYCINVLAVPVNCNVVIPPPPVVADAYVGVRIQVKQRIVANELRVKATYKLANGATKTSNTTPAFGELNDLVVSDRLLESFDGQVTVPAQIVLGLIANIKGNETHTLVASQLGGGNNFSYWDFEITTQGLLAPIYGNPPPHPVFSNPTSATTNVTIPAGVNVILIAVYE